MDVLLVSLREDLGEIRELIAAAGYRLTGEILQRRGEVHPRYFVGKGKLEEVRDALSRSPMGAVVFNGELKPSQHYTLEKELGVECFDRVRVILEIFTQRAHSREAKLQVELARLKYQIPFLREWIHQAEVGERPGFMAGGEYRVEAYYDTVKRRIKKISDDLEQIRREREARRAHRRRKGFHLVSLAGYTNAGKSSLLNALSGEHVLVEDHMFTTLSTTTRRLSGGEEKILLTDTVGFIDEVPVWLIEAFRATLEEVFQADLILLVVDGSDPFDEMERKLEVAARVMMPQVDRRRTLVLVSKADLVPEERRRVLREALAASAFHQEGLWVSAVTGEGSAPLVATVRAWFFPPVDLAVELALGDEPMRQLSWMYENAEVLSVAYGDPIQVLLRCDRGVQGILEGRGLRTRVLSLPPTPGS